MKKIMMVLIMAFTMMTSLFADVTLLPEDVFNDCLVPAFEDTPSQPQIAYVADTWEDVYEKTGVDKYSWKERLSTYCDCTDQQLFIIIIKCKVRGDLGWMCYEFPGDGSLVLYTVNVEF